MNPTYVRLKKTIIILWQVFSRIILGILFIFLLISLVIQIPTVQNYIVDKITHFISDKTHSRVEIGHVYILFPKTISLKDVFMDDLKRDTLLFSKSINIDIDMLALFSKELELNTVQIVDLTSHISRQTSDSGFNFSFLSEAFADSSEKKVEKDSSHAEMKIHVEEVQLKNIFLVYHDDVTGNYIKTKLGKFNVSFSQFDLNQQLFDIDDMAIENTTATILQTKNDTTTLDTSDILPKLNFKKITLTTIVATYKNVASDQQLQLGIGKSELVAKKMDLSASQIQLSSFQLYNTSLDVAMKKDSLLDTVPLEKKNIEDNKWIISLDRMDLSNTNFSLNYVNEPNIKRGMDMNHLSLKNIRVVLEDLYLSSKKVNLSLKELVFAYFNPYGLPKSNPDNIISLRGKVSGELDKLRLDDWYLALNEESRLSLSGNIDGISNIHTTYYDIHLPLFFVSKKDLVQFIPDNVWPSVIHIPEEVSIDANFKGQIQNFDAEATIQTSIGNAKARVDMESINGRTHYQSMVAINSFDIGKLLNDTATLGKLTLDAKVNGSGLTAEDIHASVIANMSSFEFKDYTYRHLKVDGAFTKREFSGKAFINDSNLVCSVDGTINLEEGKEEYVFVADLKGADLQKLNLNKDDIRLSAYAEVDLRGSGINTFNGKAGITNIVLVKQDKTYIIDSLLFASVNEDGKSDMRISSSILTAQFNGNFSPIDIVPVLSQHLDRYIDIESSTQKVTKPQNFNFEIEVHNNPIVSEVLIPSLEEFNDIYFQGSFVSQESKFLLSGFVPTLKYAGNRLDSLKVNVESNADKITYAVSVRELSSPSLKIEKASIKGSAQNNRAETNLIIQNAQGKEKIKLESELRSSQKKILFKILPQNFVLNGQEWIVENDNYIQYSEQGLLIHQLNLRNNEQYISVNSQGDQPGSDIEIRVDQFDLVTISQLIEKDSALVRGLLDGDVDCKNMNSSPGFTANVNVRDLVIKEYAIGDVALKADNLTTNRYSLFAILSEENKITLQGYYEAIKESSYLNFNINIESLKTSTLAAFSRNELSKPSGELSGKIEVKGDVNSPELNGNIRFHNVAFHDAYVNNYFTIEDANIKIDPQGIYFSSFTLLDSLDQQAVINGSIYTKSFSDLSFDLQVRTDDFLVVNTTEKDNELWYGTLILDCDLRIKGDQSLPKVVSQVKFKEGSHFTFAVPESKFTEDRGDGVVEFVTEGKIHPILTKEKGATTQTEMKGLDFSAEIEIDKNSSLKIMVDPTSDDSLVVKGDATLSFAIDPSGKISLTGNYTIAEGSYQVSMEKLIHKNFEIGKGSTINWNGDPLDAEIDITAIYTIKTSPIDLVADQISELSKTEQNTYKQKLPFEVILKMRGLLVKPDLQFEIQLPPEYRGALGGTVYAKLNILNEDPSELNKQVFALLVLNRFVQQDPLASAGEDGTTAAVRESVSKFLSQQLNKLSENYIKGVELDFDLQSYDDYSQGEAIGRTQLGVGVKKKLFNERLSVQVGSSVDLEGEWTKQNNASELTGDVNVEYKVTEDGRYSLKAFRQNQYEGIIEGQLSETGVGVIYSRDYNTWRELFSRSKRREEISIPAKDK